MSKDMRQDEFVFRGGEFGASVEVGNAERRVAVFHVARHQLSGGKEVHGGEVSAAVHFESSCAKLRQLDNIGESRNVKIAAICDRGTRLGEICDMAARLDIRFAAAESQRLYLQYVTRERELACSGCIERLIILVGHVDASERKLSVIALGGLVVAHLRRDIVRGKIERNGAIVHDG